MRTRLRGAATDRETGNAIVEFVTVGVLGMLPIVYLVVAVFSVQRDLFAVTQAAREAGRAAATAPSVDELRSRARYAVDLALGDQGLPAGGASVRFTPPTDSCAEGATDGAETLQPGADFAVCVTRTLTVPGVPGYLAGHRNTVTGRYVVRVDRYRSAP